MAGSASASTYVAGALFGRLALCRYNNIVSGLGQTNQPAIRKQRFASPKPTRQLAMEEQQFLFRAGRVDGSVRTVDVGIPPPIVHHLHVPLSLSLSTQYVGPLRCVALFNQKHASPRLGQMIPRVAGGRTDGIYHCFAAPIHTIAGRITGPNAIESIPPPSVMVRTYCQVLHTTERYVGTYEKPDDGSVAAAAARINTTTYDT